MARLKVKYTEEVAPALFKKFGYMYHSVFTENMTAHVIRMWSDYSYNINYPAKKVPSIVIL